MALRLSTNPAVLPAIGEGKVLIVNDEGPERRTLHTLLIRLGFDVGEATGAEEALAVCRVIRYDAVLFDTDLPGKSEIDLCMELRMVLPRAAILMLSAKDDQEWKVEALGAGADYYLAKPFHAGELTARICAALRRARPASYESEDVIAIGDLILHPARRLVQQKGSIIRLTPKEFDLLLYLMRRAGKPIAHRVLLHAIWGAPYTTHVEYLRSMVLRIRKKLGDQGDNPRYLLTHSNIGYRFADPAGWPASGSLSNDGQPDEFHVSHGSAEPPPATLPC